MTFVRKSHTTLGRIYFFTATIHQWRPLLYEPGNRELIVDYLKNLSGKGLVTVFAFVLMPNHLHLIWRQNKLNGKEKPQSSFLKYSAHEFLKVLKATGQSEFYKIKAANKAHEIWQRDSLSVELFSRDVAEQKLRYIHANPVKGKWKLAKDDMGYSFSSARFYETGVDEFGFLKNIFDEFDGY